MSRPGHSALNLLVPALKRREDSAVERFLAVLWKPTCLLCKDILGDHNAAEDAAQESFIKALKKLDQFNDSQAFRPWFFRIARNTALDHWRSRKRRQAAEKQLANKTPTQKHRSELALKAEAQLAKLPKKLRDVVTLHYFGGLSIDEVSDTLGCPRGTAASRLARGKDELRRALAPLSLSILAAFTTIDEASAFPVPASAGTTILSASQQPLVTGSTVSTTSAAGSLSGLSLSVLIGVILLFSGALTLVAPSSPPEPTRLKLATGPQQQQSFKTDRKGPGKTLLTKDSPKNDKRQPQGQGSDKEKNREKPGNKTTTPKIAGFPAHPLRIKVKTGNEAIPNAAILFVGYALQLEAKLEETIREIKLPRTIHKTDKNGIVQTHMAFNSATLLKLVVDQRSLIMKATTNGEELDTTLFSGGSGDVNWRVPFKRSGFDDQHKYPGIVALRTNINERPKQGDKPLTGLEIVIEPYTLTVKGRLISDENEDAIPGANISVGPYSCISGSDGQFELDVPSISENDRLVIEAEGYSRAQSHLAGFFYEAQNKGKMALKSDIGTYRLKQQLTFKGFVVNEDNETIPNVQIQLKYQRPDRGIPAGRQEQEFTLKTDQQGRFEQILEPGGSKIGPYATKLMLSFSVKSNKYAPLQAACICDPNTKEQKFVLKKSCHLTGTVTPLKPGNSSPILIFVRPQKDLDQSPPHSFRSKKWARKLRRRSPLQKEGAEEEFESGRLMRVFNDGHFVMKNLPMGPVQICAWSEGAISKIYNVMLRDGPNEISLKLKPTREIHGQVRSPDGRDIYSALVYAYAATDEASHAKTPKTLSLTLEENANRRAFVAIARTDSDGKFTLKHLGDGPYDLLAIPNSFYCSTMFRYTKEKVPAGAQNVQLTSSQLGCLHIVAKQAGVEGPAFLDSLTVLDKKNRIVAHINPRIVQHFSRDIVLPAGQYTLITRLNTQLKRRDVVVKSGEKQTISLGFEKEGTTPTVTVQFAFPKKPIGEIEVSMINAKNGEQFRELITSPGLSRLKKTRLPAWVGANLIRVRWKVVGEKKTRESFMQCITQSRGESVIKWALKDN